MLSEREIDYLPQIKNAISSLIKNDIQKIHMNELLLTKLIGEGGQAKEYMKVIIKIIIVQLRYFKRKIGKVL